MKAVYCYKVTNCGETLYTSTKMKDNEGNVIDVPADAYKKAHEKIAISLPETTGIHSKFEPISCNEYMAMTNEWSEGI